ncbi:MAG: hypothetical protein WDO73_00320 [Ignavibacteriota bacterium]
MFVDVWELPLCDATFAGRELDEFLSPEERQRAARFHFPVHAARYRICHAAVRQVLGDYLGVPGTQVGLTVEATGKPRLIGDSTLRFNLSHSADLALLAVSDGMDLGVDVEAIRSDISVDWARPLLYGR